MGAWQSDQFLSIGFGESVRKWVAVPLLDEGEVRFDASESDAIFNEWKKGIEGKWTSIQEEQSVEKDRLRHARDEWELKTKNIDHLCERLSLLLLLLLRNMHRLDHLLNDGLVGLGLIVDHCLCRMDQLLELGNIVFEKLNRIPNRGLLSLKGPGELECRLKLAGEGFEAADDVFWDVGSWLRPVVIIIVRFCE